MKKFLRKSFVFSLPTILIPTLILVGIYIITDPFRVVHHYDDYYKNTPVVLNRDYISTTNYLRIRREVNPNAFIFGNSRTIFWSCSTWKLYLPDNARPYHYDASGDDIYGIWRKMVLIDSLGGDINHALIVIDPQSFNTTPHRKAPLFNRPIEINPHTTTLKEHSKFFKASLNLKFLRVLIDFHLNNEEKPYMTNVLSFIDKSYNMSNNEITYPVFDSLHLNAPNEYYTPERLSVFANRDTTQVNYSKSLLTDQALVILNNIKALLDKHETDYRIVINPLYRLQQFLPDELADISEIFEGNLYDFSGLNDFTRDYRNYYEDSHYRPHVADSMMRKIYSDPKIAQ